MFDKAFVESFLRVNNTSVDASEDEIKHVLRGANWSGQEIEVALRLLKDKSVKTEDQGSVFKPGLHHSSNELSVLLGTDVVVDPYSLRAARDPDASSGSRIKYHLKRFFTGLLIVAISLCVAIGAGFFIAYITQAGPFHSPIETWSI